MPSDTLSPTNFTRHNGLNVFDMPALQLRIVGIVQGVGYRYALQREAARLGLIGWVRNRADGSVESVAQGSAEALEALAAWARRGPPAARVSGVTASAAEQDDARQSFEIRPTA
jgi:acylphosphatase